MYEAYLRNLLEPLGVYDLSQGTVNAAALGAAAVGLDGISQRLETVEREALTATAEGEGLSRREALFTRKPAAHTAQERQAALAALLQIDGDSLTPSAIDRTIQGCGILAQAQEMGGGHLRVRFPKVAGEPEGFQQIRKILLDILPCHLEVEFYFRYLLWSECEQQGLTWAGVEAAGHTWASFQVALPPESGANGEKKGKN